MRIYGSFSFDPRELQPGAPRTGKSDRARGEVSASAAASAEGAASAGSSYISMAMAMSDYRPDVVEEARRLLSSGQLDTPQAAQEAADAILARGI